MISINDVDCEFLWNGTEFELTEDVKRRWNSMDEQERSKYLTTISDRIWLSANDVLGELYEQLEDTYGFDELTNRLWDDTTDNFFNRFQDMLDEISEFESAEFLTTNDEIDTTIDLKEVEK